LTNVKNIAVLDRSVNYGGNAPIYNEILSSFAKNNKKINIQSCIFGLGGREINLKQIEDIFISLLANKVSSHIRYIGLNE